eukprot:5975040-Pleurochrysis_carterae.AAC.1
MDESVFGATRMSGHNASVISRAQNDSIKASRGRCSLLTTYLPAWLPTYPPGYLPTRLDAYLLSRLPTNRPLTCLTACPPFSPPLCQPQSGLPVCLHVSCFLDLCSTPDRAHHTFLTYLPTTHRSPSATYPLPRYARAVAARRQRGHHLHE